MGNTYIDTRHFLEDRVHVLIKNQFEDWWRIRWLIVKYKSLTSPSMQKESSIKSY